MKNKPFIIFAGMDWWYHSHAHADVQLAINLAIDRPVLFVNTLGMRMPLPSNTEQPLRRIFRKIASTSKLLKRPKSELKDFGVLSAINVPLFGSPKAAAVNARIVAAQVRWALRRLGISQPICVVTIPTAIDVVDRMESADVIYYRSDNHSADPGVNPELIRSYEDRMFARASYVLYSSRALLESEHDRHKGKAVFFDQGIDAAKFLAPAPINEPLDLASIPRPRIGYYGQLEPHGVDMDLLCRTAREIPEASLVLVGNSAVDTTLLAAFSNVYMLGAKPHAQIPAYGHGFDLAIMPRPDSLWSRSTNPIKLKEYLALGLPIVSTWIPELAYYQDVVRVANTPDEFIAAIRKTLQDGGVGSAESRRALVAEATWSKRAEQLVELTAI
jgi:glycosyltransferase involved in cell wall biosynthesis